MKIITDYWAKPIPDRSFDWSAIDHDSYDGADDSSTRNQIGYGRTEAVAIADLTRLLDETDAAERERDPDLVREVCEERRARATARRHRTAWDEPPEFYDDEEAT